jgi:hypothetical protein
LAREVLKLEAAQALPESYYAGATARILCARAVLGQILGWLPISFYSQVIFVHRGIRISPYDHEPDKNK